MSRNSNTTSSVGNPGTEVVDGTRLMQPCESPFIVSTSVGVVLLDVLVMLLGHLLNGILYSSMERNMALEVTNLILNLICSISQHLQIFNTSHCSSVAPDIKQSHLKFHKISSPAKTECLIDLFSTYHRQENPVAKFSVNTGYNKYT